MNDRVTEVAAGIDAVAVPLGLARLETMGVVGSGAFEYYKVRLQHGTIFADYELALARAILAWPEALGMVHEVGGGLGELSILLTKLGIRTICLEHDERRFDASVDLLEKLSEIYPDLIGNCQIIYASFPMSPGALSPRGAMALSTNLICTTTAQAKAEIMAALKAYPCAIIDIDRFLVECKTLEERASRLAEFSRAGFASEQFLDLGKSACLYRFSGG
jgi:hypothetical protein